MREFSVHVDMIHDPHLSAYYAVRVEVIHGSQRFGGLRYYHLLDPFESAFEYALDRVKHEVRELVKLEATTEHRSQGPQERVQDHPTV